MAYDVALIACVFFVASGCAVLLVSLQRYAHRSRMMNQLTEKPRTRERARENAHDCWFIDGYEDFISWRVIRRWQTIGLIAGDSRILGVAAHPESLTHRGVRFFAARMCSRGCGHAFSNVASTRRCLVLSFDRCSDLAMR